MTAANENDLGLELDELDDWRDGTCATCADAARVRPVRDVDGRWRPMCADCQPPRPRTHVRDADRATRVAAARAMAEVMRAAIAARDMVEVLRPHLARLDELGRALDDGLSETAALVRQLRMAFPSISDAELADALGVARSTVLRARRAMLRHEAGRNSPAGSGTDDVA